MKIKPLIAFLQSLSAEECDEFAGNCGVSSGHLRNVAYGCRTCGESLAVEIEKWSEGKVPCESLRTDVDWAYLRGSKSSPRRDTTRRCG